LGVVELHSVFARLVCTGQITAADFHVARGRFLADIAAGLWQVVPVSVAHYHHGNCCCGTASPAVCGRWTHSNSLWRWVAARWGLWTPSFAPTPTLVPSPKPKA